MKYAFAIACFFVTSASIGFAQDAAPEAPPSPSDLTSESALEQVNIKIDGGREIDGTLSTLDSVEAYTSFGSVKIPVTTLAGIKFHADDTDAAVFSFNNGDMLTAHIKLPEVAIETDWGSANVRVANIDSLKLNKQGEFYKDTSNPSQPRWRFGETRVVAQNTASK